MSNHSNQATDCPVCSTDTLEQTAIGDYTATYRRCPVCEWTTGDEVPATQPRYVRVGRAYVVRTDSTGPRE